MHVSWRIVRTPEVERRCKTIAPLRGERETHGVAWRTAYLWNLEASSSSMSRTPRCAAPGGEDSAQEGSPQGGSVSSLLVSEKRNKKQPRRKRDARGSEPSLIRESAL